MDHIGYVIIRLIWYIHPVAISRTEKVDHHLRCSPYPHFLHILVWLFKESLCYELRHPSLPKVLDSSFLRRLVPNLVVDVLLWAHPCREVSKQRR